MFNKIIIVTIFFCTALLSACGGSGSSVLLDADHSVKFYYQHDQVRADTIKACGATTSAQADANLKRKGCRRAMKAEFMLETGRKPD